MKQPSPKADESFDDSFTDIYLDEIDVDRSNYDDTIKNLTCLSNYVDNSPLQPHQMRKLYLITVAWIKPNLKKEVKKKIGVILPLAETEIEQLNDEAIARIFPHLEKIWAEHNIIWHLLDKTAFILEEEAGKLIKSGSDYQKTIISMQQARQTFINICKKIVKAVVEDTTQSNKNKQDCILTYVSIMVKCFALWRDNSIPPEIFAHSQFFIDLTDLDLRVLDLSNIPLQHADLKDSRLAGSCLSKTTVSAVQLSKAKEFSLVEGLSAELLLEAQTEQYGLWQHRLENHAKSFNKLRAEINAYDPNNSPHIARNLSAFEFSAKCYDALTKQKTSLDAHCSRSAQKFDKVLFLDLTTAQQKTIHLQLENFEKEEALLKQQLVSANYEARCNLCIAYFKEIEKNLNVDHYNLPKALQQFDELLILRLPDKDKDPLPSDLDAKILEVRNDFLYTELSLVKKFLIITAGEKATKKNSTLAKKALQHIDFMLNHTPEWALPLELEVAINKARRDWIHYRIEVEIAQGKLQQAETLIEKLLSEEEIRKQAARCFNELKDYKIEPTDDFLETKIKSEEKERCKIYISTQIAKDYLIFDRDGIVYRGALSSEQMSVANNLDHLLKSPKSRNSIFMKAAEEDYVHLKFYLKLRIVEEHIKKSESNRHDSDADSALGKFYQDNGQLARARSPLQRAESKLQQARIELELARNKFKGILAAAMIQKYTLDLRQRSIFTNRELWKDLPIQNVRLYLNNAQTAALTTEQRLQYNEALFYAIANGNLEQVRYGIEYLSWSARLSNGLGCTSVIFACLHGHLDIAHYLEGRGSKITPITSPGKADINPLDELIQKKYLENKELYGPIILWLMRNGLELDAKNALFLGNNELFKKSFSQPPDDNSTKEKTRELLLTAVKKGDGPVVKWILEHHRDCAASFPTAETKVGFFAFFSAKVTPTPVPQEPSLLHIACKEGHVTIVNILRDQDTAAFESNKQAALVYLAQSFLEKHRLLGKNPLEFQALYDKWKGIATILCANCEKCSKGEKCTNGTKCPPGAKHDLYTWLILNDDLKLKNVAQYINKDTIDTSCDAHGNTPLHLAVKTSNINLVRFLIANNARLEPVNLAQETPLYLACEQGHLGIVKCLLEAEVSPDGPRLELTESESKNFNDLAKTIPQIKAVKLPLRLKKDTPLHCAIKNNHPDIVEILCRYQADLEVKPLAGTALNIALQLIRTKEDGQKISVKMATILLKHGANISERDDNGELPMDIAVRTRNIEAILLLLNAVMTPSLQPRGVAIQQAVLANLLKVDVKENFCNDLEEWALSFRKALHSSEFDSTVPAAAPATQLPCAVSSALPLSSSLSSSSLPSSSLSSSSLPSSSLSSSCSIFSTAKRTPPPPGTEFDTHLNEYFKEIDEPTPAFDLQILPYDDEEGLSSTPPEQKEPFYVVPSSPEEIERKEKEEEEDRNSGPRQFRRF